MQQEGLHMSISHNAATGLRSTNTTASYLVVSLQVNDPSPPGNEGVSTLSHAHMYVHTSTPHRVCGYTPTCNSNVAATGLWSDSRTASTMS